MIDESIVKVLENTFPPIKLNRGRVLPSIVIMTDEKRLSTFDFPLNSFGKNVAVIVRARDRQKRLKILNFLQTRYNNRKFSILVSNDFELAKKADGLHIPEQSLNHGTNVWRRFRPFLGLVTASAHSAEAIRKAIVWGVDGIILSPIMKTTSHPKKAALGLLRFTRLCHKSKSPIIALGGVKIRHTKLLRNAKAAGVAGIEIFMSSDY